MYIIKRTESDKVFKFHCLEKAIKKIQKINSKVENYDIFYLYHVTKKLKGIARFDYYEKFQAFDY